MRIPKKDEACSAISLSELFKNVVLSLYKDRFPDAEPQEIIEVQQQIDQLIAEIKKDFEQCLRPLEAAIKLGNEQFVIWNQLDDNLTDQILSANDMDLFLAGTCQPEKTFSVELTIKQIEATKLIAPYLTLYEQSIKAYENSFHELAAIGFLAIADGLFAEKIADKTIVNFYKRAISLVEQIFDKQRVPNLDMDLAFLGVTLIGITQSLSQRVEFEKTEPHKLNRNWIMHGRSRRKRTKLDCIKLIRLIYGIILIDDFSEKKVINCV